MPKLSTLRYRASSYLVRRLLEERAVALLRFFMAFVFRVFFNFKIYNQKILSAPGPLIITPNHVSWLDALLLVIATKNDFRFVGSHGVAKSNKLISLAAKLGKSFLIDPAVPYAMRDVVRFLQAGGKVVIFPEGSISHSGRLRKFFDGVGFLLYKSGANVIPCHIQGAENSCLARRPGKKSFFPSISVHFGDIKTPPNLENCTAFEKRKQISNWLRDEILEHQFAVENQSGDQNILLAIENAAQKQPRKIIIDDITFSRISYFKFILGSKLLAPALLNKLPKNNNRVGVLLPNVAATPILLAALWRTHTIPAILNFSSGAPTLLQCLSLAKIDTIITSKAFLEKSKFDITPFINAKLKIVYLEEVKASIGKIQTLVALFRHYLFPNPGASLSPAEKDGTETAVILFTSGSEGTPKGVELSHKNITANIRQVAISNDLTQRDRVFNALPMFHSFGLTVGTLFPLVQGLYVFTYPSPLHYRAIPNFVYDIRCTIMLGTNTFLNGYARRSHPYDFDTVRYAVAGAEKVQEATATIWAQKFGVRLLEGYGATECAPCLAINTSVDPQYGSVGKFLPGIKHRLVKVEGVEQGGRLFVSGPNVMKGYLNPEANAKFLADNGWYDTGDIVQIDKSGFIKISGRVKRFAKISGEMVSLIAIEDAINKHIAEYGNAMFFDCAVTSIQSKDKGETIIAVCNNDTFTTQDMRLAIQNAGLPSICIPKTLFCVASIPKLGTGKADFIRLQEQVNLLVKNQNQVHV